MEGTIKIMFHFSDSASEYKPWKIFLAMELTVHHTQKVNVKNSCIENIKKERNIDLEISKPCR